MFTHTIRLLILVAAVSVFAGTAAAQGSCANCTTVSSNLNLSATAQTAIKLVISTNGGVTVSDSGSGVYTVPFGSVNGLGVGTPDTGVAVAVTGSGATYTTPISVTPSFSGFANTTATVKVYQDATTSGDSQSAAREGSSPESVAVVPTTSGTANTVDATAATATGITRHVGVFVSNVNGGSKVVGALAPKFIYMVTVN